MICILSRSDFFPFITFQPEIVEQLIFALHKKRNIEKRRLKQEWKTYGKHSTGGMQSPLSQLENHVISTSFQQLSIQVLFQCWNLVMNKCLGIKVIKIHIHCSGETYYIFQLTCREHQHQNVWIALGLSMCLSIPVLPVNGTLAVQVLFH